MLHCASHAYRDFYTADIRAKCLRSNNPNNVVGAAIEGLKSMRSAEQVAKIRGKSVDEIIG